jgi:hypothetical protein
VCESLTNSAVLAQAEQAVRGAIPSTLVAQLTAIEKLAPTEMQAPFDNIIAGLKDNQLDIVGPDARLLAGECRARNLPIPAVT